MKKLFFICTLLIGTAQATIDMQKLFTLPESIVRLVVTKIVEQLSSNTNKQRSLSLDINLEKPIEEQGAREDRCRKIFKGPLTLAQR